MPTAVALELGISWRRCDQRRPESLAACAQGRAETWAPGGSGGAPHPAGSAEVLARLKKRIASKPPSADSAWARELHRRLGFKTNRARLRRGARPNQLAPAPRYQAAPKPVKRWPARDLGALGQSDASPQAGLPGPPGQQVLLDLWDDAPRLKVGARRDPSETLWAHRDCLARVFQTHGLPLALELDFHSFFYTHNPDAFPQLGQALHCYGVKLLYAPTPQAKGRIERRPDSWQKRLPPLLAPDPSNELERAHRRLDPLLSHAPQHEIHRELGPTPHAAETQALAEKRSVRRPAPACLGWPFVCRISC